MAMEQLVRHFNGLPRPQQTPTGLPNHWVFGLRHVPLQPPGDLLVAVHPQSQFIVQAGPEHVLNLSTSAEKAEAIAPMLLKAFRGSDGKYETLPWVPWSWATEEQELGSAIEAKLRQYSVKEELCHVSVCSLEEKGIIDECFVRLMDEIMTAMGRSAKHKRARAEATPLQSAIRLGDDSQCHGCAKKVQDLLGGLKRCSACAQVWYCSRSCQKEHWRRHKPECAASRPRGSDDKSSSQPSSTDVDAFTYFSTKAHAVPQATALAHFLNLDLPSSIQSCTGIGNPLRRLIVTGKDTPENLGLLFGSKWRQTSAYEDARIYVLLNPPRGSPAYVKYAQLDNGAPTWSPRPASEAEQARVAEVREMQARILERVGSGRSPSNEQMVSILTSFGVEWSSKLPLYQLAVNTMDQGVRPS